MRRNLLLVLAVTWPSAALAQVPSGVYRWADLTTEPGPRWITRPVFQGSTTDLAVFTVRAVTLPPGSRMDQGAHAAGLETILIVKQGRLAVTLPSGRTVAGPRGVALIMPGDAYTLEDVDTLAATYYELRYRAKAPSDAERGRAAGGSQVVCWEDLAFHATETGGRRQPFDRATAMVPRFEMHVTTLNAGLASHPPHTHRAAEMVLMLRGDAMMTIGGTQQAASAGDVIFLESEVPHALDNTGPGPAEYFAFQWQTVR
jgi:(S)-ureidoglycine aminohydrolase